MRSQSFIRWFGPFFTLIVAPLLYSPEKTTADDKIYAASETLWTQQKIEVCWEISGNEFSLERQWVQDQIQKTWVANSSLQFSGWGKCPSVGGGIRIQIGDINPRTKGLGRQLNNVPQGMALNFTFNNFSRAYCLANIPGRREHCIRVVAMHEFGHALGFSHEQNRADAPDWCHAESQGSNGDIMVTDFDLRSVMNYCLNSSWPDNEQLSSFDLVGLQRIYGVPGGSIPQNPARFAVNLTAQHPECNNMNKSRSAECVSAVQRVCAVSGRGSAGLIQEINYSKGVFGVGCFNPSRYTIAHSNELRQFHQGCHNATTQSTSLECLIAVRRWCLDKKYGNSGLTQQINHPEFGVACIQADSFDMVPIASLRAEHDNCSDPNGVGEGCFAAAHRWCARNRRGVLGLPQEPGNQELGIACFIPTWYGEIAIR